MKIEFKHILIENFKSIKRLKTDFGFKTFVLGANETGKTTFADAISWVLTGKNSLGDSQFEIVPIETSGISPSVTLTVEIDDGKNKKETILTRTYLEKQNRAKEFTGDYQTICYVNKLKVSVKEFDKWIEEHICNPEVFRLVHDVRYFTENISVNGKERPWEAQRRFLFSISGIKHDIDFAKNKKRYEPIFHGLEMFDNASRYLTFLKKEESTINIEINQNRSWIENFSDILGNEKLGNPDEILSELESAILKFSVDQSEYLEKSKELNIQRKELADSFTDIKIKMSIEENELKNLKKKYDSMDVECPTCHQYIPVDMINERMVETEIKIDKSKGKIADFKKEMERIKNQIEKIDNEINGLHPPAYSDKMNELNEKAGWARNYKNAKSNIKETEEKIKILLEKRAENSRLMDLCRDFIDAKCNYAEKKVNSIFDGIEFKLFHQNKTNDEVRECCSVFWNGVPYDSLSYSTKFIVSLKITLAFQKFYNVSMPIVIDNAESIDVAEDIPVQSIMLEKKDMACPKCGSETGRKEKDGKWSCKQCGERFTKHLEIITK